MKYELAQTDTKTILSLIGEIVAADKGSFNEVIAKTTDAGKPIDIDFSKLEFMDSAGLGFLLSLWQHTNEQGLKVTIKNANGEVKDLLELSDFQILFSFE